MKVPFKSIVFSVSKSALEHLSVSMLGTMKVWYEYERTGIGPFAEKAA